MERPVLVIPAEHIPELERYPSGEPRLYTPTAIMNMPYSSMSSRAKRHYARAMFELALATYWTARDAEVKAKAKEAREKAKERT